MEELQFPARADLGFAWGVKDSFLQYIRGMRDGRVEWRGGAAVTSADEFYFPLSDIRTTEEGVNLEFRGEIRFTAHHGLLSVLIADPRVQLHATKANLSVRWGRAETTIAIIDPSPWIVEGDVAMSLNSPVFLSDGGLEVFGDTYPTGERLAPLTLRVPATALARG